MSLSFASDDLFFALPTLGCFLPGYSLIVSRAHFPSVADMSREGLVALNQFVERIRAATAMACGGAIVAEHGSGSPDEPTAACCEHAHLHIIPVGPQANSVLRYYEARGGRGHQLSSIIELGQYAGTSYLSLSIEPGQWRVWPDALKFPRQFVRRAVAESIGNPDMFDWRAHPFVENMERTRVLLSYAVAAVERECDS